MVFVGQPFELWLHCHMCPAKVFALARGPEEEAPRTGENVHPHVVAMQGWLHNYT